ncbi:schwannomin-interacting protein 1 [Caerostris extrusa]|uniref:Schwannomin-interacting protein 1 n=1 Tax=Caerostris extrusa TaxID=172846 RepID=A0AAV4Y145_CAEEX|nr:schwannomin-interacting protein 1 [Caerostris extrusa]
MPWSVDAVEGMRLKQEIRQVEPPHSLVLCNNSTRDIDDISFKKVNTKVSPETLSHRLEKGWQHLQECSDSFLNNNNNSLDLNDNKLDDGNVATSSEVSPSFVDGDYRNMSSDDSDSSSDDESSASYSDTSPLLDVSSLGNSDVSLDSDMSEDSSSSSNSSSSSSDGDMLDGCNNFNNNNGDEEEDMSIMDAPSMQSSWMSFSSAASTPSMAGPSRGQIVLPDVLPIGKMPKNDDEDPVLCDNGSSASYSAVSTRNLEITFEKKRSHQDLGAPRMSGDCCLVEITAQPDVQVDIRVNPMSSRPHREPRTMSIKHGNTYPREARNNKRYLKNRDISAWIVNDSFDEYNDDKSNKEWTLDEGIRLNNFTIVNGYKTLSLTELVNPNTNEENQIIQKLETDTRRTLNDSRSAKTNMTTFTNSYRNFERNYSKLG